MIVPLKVQSSHEDLFVDRYRQLLAWSMQLTGHDRDLAEDILHDAFVQFTFARPDLNGIRNLDGYFYNMLRNLHISQVRREARNRLQQFPVIEYDSADDGLRTTDLRDQQQVESDLRKVCNYACARKETASAASVLILRFFHGYYPSEISRILRTSRQAIDVKLLIARREAQLSFDSPTTVTFIAEKQTSHAQDNFLDELRLMIFDSSRGQCLSRKQLRDLYSVTHNTRMDCAELAHIVSCPTCLDEVNKILGLPSLSERTPTNMLGRDKRTKGPHGRGPKGPGASGITSWRQRARRVFEHKPQELCVAVNGYLQASQTVNSELSELNLNIDLLEDVSFVEVFSEQKLRLLLLNVDELPPAGPGELGRLLEMSDGRTLSLKLEFRSPRPAVSVAYHDPTFKDVQELLDSSAIEDSALPVVPPSAIEEGPSLTGGSFSFLERVRHALFGRGFWLAPGTITAVLALLLIGALFFVRLRVANPPPTAADLLQKASVAEDVIAARTDTVLHRSITVEEYRIGPDSKSASMISRHKVESWHSAEKGVTVRRFFDDKSNLVAGDWRRSDGARTIYHHGVKPQLQRGASLSFDNAWQSDLTAKDFISLIGKVENARVEESANAYVLSVESVDVPATIIKATLTLSKPDLHATEETITLQQGNERREYRMMETSYERRPTSTVAPAVFEPEPELTGDAATRGHGDTELVPGSPRLPIAASPATIATAELEVEVLRLINRAGADLGDQVTVRRTPEGQLLVQGMVETIRRKEEILRALDSVTDNPAVKLKIQTIAEALKEQAKQRDSSANPTTVEHLESGASKVAVDAELRRYFTTKGLSGAQLDQSVNQFAARMVEWSLQAMRHASALDRLAQRFSSEQLRTLDPEARKKWLGLLRGHAQAIARDVEGLRGELAPFISSGSGSESQPAFDINSDQDLQQAIHRLFQLCSANDQLIRSAFTISESGSKGSAINSPQFFRSLRECESLASRISLAVSIQR